MHYHAVVKRAIASGRASFLFSQPASDLEYSQVALVVPGPVHVRVDAGIDIKFLDMKDLVMLQNDTAEPKAA